MIGVAIYNILKNDTDVSALVGTKIYPIQVKEGDSVPYITYQVISNIPSGTKKTSSLLDYYRVQISSFATKHEDAEVLAKKIRDVLDNHALENFYSTSHIIKITSVIFDGEISLGLDNANVFEIAQDYIVTANVIDKSFSDWFLPSKDLLAEMYTNLHAEGVGSFGDNSFWSSSEYDAAEANYQIFGNGNQSRTGKGSGFYVRACWVFTATAGIYSLRDTGPAGGLIFYISGTTYYEAAPANQSANQPWSDVTNVEIGASAQGTAIGTGQANTTAIIAQDGHTDSAAKLCNDLEI